MPIPKSSSYVFGLTVPAIGNVHNISRMKQFLSGRKATARTQFDSIRCDAGYLDVVIFSSYSNLMEGHASAAIECIAAVL